MMTKFSKRQAYANGLALLEAVLTNNPNKVDTQIPFHGFGALKELLLPLDNKDAWSAEDLRHHKEVLQFHSLLQRHFGANYGSALASLKTSILSSFYTPDFITRAMVSSIKNFNADIQSVLEPAAGTGNFVATIKNAFPKASITAIEKDDTTFAVLKFLHSNIETIHNSYENFKNRKYDLVISNIPFGNVNVFDEAIFREATPAKVKSTTRIHNYYFVKSLDNLNDHGIIAFVAPSGVMDTPANQEVRQYLVKNADLLAATRLPNSVFEQAGTFPVTDIIILRRHRFKHSLTQNDKWFITQSKIEVPNQQGAIVELDINDYYQNHRDHILGTLIVGGQYDGRSLDVTPHPKATPTSLEDAVGLILDEGLSQETPLMVMSSKAEDQETTLPALPKEHPDFMLLKSGNLVIHKNQVGIIEAQGDIKVIRYQPIVKDLERTFLVTSLRNEAVRLIQSELEGNNAAMTRHRQNLNTKYDEFVFRYGNLNHPTNKKLILLDAEGFKMLSLERQLNGQYAKADIFHKQVNNVIKNIGRPETLNDAILQSLNARNGIDMQFITEQMQQDRATLIREGLDAELLFYNPHTKSDGQLVTKDVFLSGNIITKIEILEDVIQNQQDFPAGISKHDIERHIELLQQAKPTYLTRELIDINIGERWIPVDIYEKFAEYIFNQKTEIKFMTSSDMFIVNIQGYSNEASITYSASTASGNIGGARILEYAMTDTHPHLQIRVADSTPPKYVPDTDGMKNVELKIKLVKDAFESFLNEHKDVTERIELLYNKHINNSVRREFDGSHLQLVDLKHFSPRSHQKDALWMILQQDGGIIDHKVGAGKTLVMITGAMEMRRLGIANKPLLLCMKANVADVTKDFIKAYPHAKVLAPDPQKDFTPARRQMILASIAINDWDAVIMTHDMFLAIPQSHEIKKEVLNEELKNLDMDLTILADNKTLSKRVLKGLEVRKQNLIARIQIADVMIKRDKHTLDFDKMGFDHIFVDESQEYKNLHFTTRHQGVAGLGDPAGSHRAMNLEFAIRTLQKKKGKDRGVTFLSGTTISNSLVEMYLLFKYLRPEKMKELQINSFDAWAIMYARKSSTYEFSVTNELKTKERFREFIKVPELARFYAEISHVVTDKNLNVDKPAVENIVINIEPTQQQQEFTKKLIDFARTKNPSYVDLSLGKNEMNAFMLIATNLAKKMSLDMRLIDAIVSFPESRPFKS